MCAETAFEGDLDQPSFRFVNHLERSPQSKPPPVLMLADTSRIPKKAAKVIHGETDPACDLIERQQFLPALAQNPLDTMDDIPRFPVGSRLPPVLIDRTNHLLEQEHHGLFYFQWVFLNGTGQAIEQSPLEQVSRRWRKPSCEPKWAFRSVINSGVVRTDNILDDVCTHPEPVTSITFAADCVSEVDLTLVVKGHDVRVSDEGMFMLVLNLHGSPGKHEATRRRWS